MHQKEVHTTNDSSSVLQDEVEGDLGLNCSKEESQTVLNRSHNTQEKRGIIPPTCEEFSRTEAAKACRDSIPHSRRALPMENDWKEIPLADCVPG